MKTLIKIGGCASVLTMLMLPLTSVQAAVFVQCPGDTDGDAAWNSEGESQPAKVKCMHLSGSDGFANMGDGYLQYIFSFGDLTGVPQEDAVDEGIMNATITAPTIVLDEGDEFYLSLTNTGMANRPDLFDPHTVHFHGFPNASSVFDGVPDASVSVNMGATLTYYYNIVEPGTYMYHCHVEAAEHMQMGMLGNLYVRPAKNGTVFTDDNGTLTTADDRIHTQFVYNDTDGSTAYDVEMPLQLTGFDPIFHDASKDTQPLPFADMKDTYHMFNGRGYPATVTGEYLDDTGKEREDLYYMETASAGGTDYVFEAQQNNGGKNSQPTASRMTVTAGKKLLLRVSSLSVTKFYTVTVLGLPMRVVGQGGRELVQKYDTASVNLGGGEAWDVIVDTQGVDPGTYHVYVTELNDLSNDQQSFGGPMTEIVVVE